MVPFVFAFSDSALSAADSSIFGFVEDDPQDDPQELERDPDEMELPGLLDDPHELLVPDDVPELLEPKPLLDLPDDPHELPDDFGTVTLDEPQEDFGTVTLDEPQELDLDEDENEELLEPPLHDDLLI